MKHAVELEIAERELHGQELQQAREIQQSLLPKGIPQVSGFEIEGAWEPASVVGGDYYDVIKLSETKLGICIADVVGKSVSAALLMANVQASVRAFATDSTAPSALCSRVNSVLCANIATGKFVTLFYAVLDAASGNLHYPPFVGLTVRTRRVINGCFVQGGQDQSLTSPVGFFELIPARNPTRPSSALLQVLRWKRVRNSGNN